MSVSICQPGEWENHDACWLAWPSHENLWEENLPAAQSEFTALARAIAGYGEKLKVLVPTAKAKADAEAALSGVNAEFYMIPFGDIWLRDTGPIFMRGPKGQAIVASFGFNGWGEKYVLPHDREVSAAVAKASGQEVHSHDWILEGGSIESDGEGTILTSRQCLLNPNRNPKLSLLDVEAKLAVGCGVTKVLWVSEGLVNDHTDGHIDTIARFVKPGEVVCMKASGMDDPNAEIFQKIYIELSAMTDAQGRRLKVHQIPSPGFVTDEDEQVMPASFLNFYIANRGVVVPVYGTPYDAAAVEALKPIFPGREVIGLSAKAILSGGGAFHCISQQEPSARKS